MAVKSTRSSSPPPNRPTSVTPAAVTPTIGPKMKKTPSKTATADDPERPCDAEELEPGTDERP